MIRSVHNPKFAELNNGQLNTAYLAAEIEREKLIKLYDGGSDVDDLLDAIDGLIFQIDDELCARGLPIPFDEL